MPPDEGARRHPQFHDLIVSNREQLTDESVALTFAVPDELAGMFLRFEAGQYLTVRALVEGEEVRQSYSLCLSPARARQLQSVRVGVSLIPGGRMSAYLNTAVEVGDSVAVLPPMGTFTVPLRPSEVRHHVMIAAGSGITPILSHVESVLTGEPASRVTLFFGNRTAADAMFIGELTALAVTYPTRFRLVQVLSREATEVPLLAGRLDPPRVSALLERYAPVPTVDEFYLCGPNGMVEGARSLLASQGVPDERVHDEVFYVPVM